MNSSNLTSCPLCGGTVRSESPYHTGEAKLPCHYMCLLEARRRQLAAEGIHVEVRPRRPAPSSTPSRGHAGTRRTASRAAPAGSSLNWSGGDPNYKGRGKDAAIPDD